MLKLDESWFTPLHLQWTYGLRKAVDMLKGAASDRKLRLLGIAFCRNVRDRLNDDRMLQAVELAERLVDSPLDDDEIIACRRVLEAAIGEDRRGRPTINNEHLVSCKHAVYGLLQEPMSHGIDPTMEATFSILQSENESYPLHAEVLLDIFGNPFRSVAFEPAWRTSNVVSLSRSMYESRDFSAMPILSDALQDAGCDHADILDHCRGSGSHVRGCWVVDLALGKA